MIRVLLCCDFDEAREKIAGRLAERGMECVSSGENAVLVIPCRTNKDWERRIADRAAVSDAGVVVIVRREDMPEAEKALAGSGATVLPADASFNAVAGALKASARAAEKMLAIRGELCRLREKFDCEKTVYRAKLVLMEKRGMTECEAHRYIEKAAMDGRLPRQTVAMGILREYGL